MYSILKRGMPCQTHVLDPILGYCNWLVEARQIFFLRLPHLIKHIRDLSWGADRSRQWIELQGVASSFLVAVQQRLAHQGMNGDMAAIQGRELFWQRSEMAGLHTILIDKAGHLDIAIGQ